MNLMINTLIHPASTRVQIIVSGATLGNPYFNTNFTASLDEGQPRFTNVTIANATVPKTPSGGTSKFVVFDSCFAAVNVDGDNDWQ